MGKKQFAKKIKDKKKRSEAKLQQTKNLAEHVKQVATINPPSVYSEKICAGENTIIFKGFSEKYAEVILRHRNVLSDFMPPLDDFYAEVKMRNGSCMKLHWVPFEGPFSKTEVQAFIKDMMFGKVFDNGTACRDSYPVSSNDIFATIYASCGMLTTIGYAWMRDGSLGVAMLPCKAEVGLAADANAAARELREHNFKAPLELERKSFKLVDKLHEIERTKNLMGIYPSLIQRLVYCYLIGEEIPRLGNTAEKRPCPSPLPSPPDLPKDETVNNASTKCIAYIYLDIEDGSVSITKGGKNYSCKWWIVSGHKRHYKDGKVVDIAPYIKGDKTDPDAIKALEAFVAGYRKIQTYQLLARKIR